MPLTRLHPPDLVFWLALVGVLAVASRGRDRVAPGEGMRLLPDVIRLLRRLAADRSVPRGARIRLGLDPARRWASDPWSLVSLKGAPLLFDLELAAIARLSSVGPGV